VKVVGQHPLDRFRLAQKLFGRFARPVFRLDARFGPPRIAGKGQSTAKTCFGLVIDHLWAKRAAIGGGGQKERLSKAEAGKPGQRRALEAEDLTVVGNVVLRPAQNRHRMIDKPRGKGHLQLVEQLCERASLVEA
jgi:hypothetical protein